jgi:hypothetical protein
MGNIVVSAAMFLAMCAVTIGAVESAARDTASGAAAVTVYKDAN